ncbi:hypothetical protein Acr_00g0051340 [Actinidia rufa]|uniref:Putative plant transposon protein domain-containing protein n=1 Tax=Actinidia rufa TaxID=165716 RepID=A0A7J0DKS1_9ERIC|nr:hypothetical protein Acr_00g0051340 [Actinidia rufa]
MSNTETGGSGRQTKSKGSSSQRNKGKEKESTNLEYDHTWFTGKVEKKLYNHVWIRNGVAIGREFNLNSFENLQFGYLEDFTNRGWMNLASFKVESILTLCQEFMSNIKHKLVIEEGKERMISWVWEKKLKITPNTFPEIYGLPRIENPEFEFSNVRMLDLDAISRELLRDDDIWDGEVQCTKTLLKDRYLILFLFSCQSLLPLKHTIAIGVTRANLLRVISTRKTIDLPRMMFIALCVAYDSSDPRGLVPYIGFPTELFKRHDVHIPVDLTRIEPEKPIDRYSLTCFEGHQKKRKVEEGASD